MLSIDVIDKIWQHSSAIWPSGDTITNTMDFWKGNTRDNI